MPTLDNEAAGSTPRTASSALARVAWRKTKSLSVGIAVDRGADVIGDLAEQQRVRVEQPVHVADVARTEPARQHRRVAVEAVAAADARVVGDVAGALLEVAHQPAPLEHLGEDVRCLLARQVHAAELGDRVVAVLEEHLLVQLLGTFADRWSRRRSGRR